MTAPRLTALQQVILGYNQRYLTQAQIAKKTGRCQSVVSRVLQVCRKKGYYVINSCYSKKKIPSQCFQETSGIRLISQAEFEGEKLKQENIHQPPNNESKQY